MIKYCERCNGEMKKYDKVKRMYKEKNGCKKYIKVQRYRCVNCAHIYRDLPDMLVPFKHYKKDIIEKVLDEIITPDTIGYEDYPCDMTKERWIKKYKYED